jgi:competence protein ComEA
MEGKFLNKSLFEKQKIVLTIFFFVYLLFYILSPEKKPKYSEDYLKININTASKEELMLVPYIGEKTADEILKIRKMEKEIKALDRLKNIKFYEKFRQFLKTQ